MPPENYSNDPYLESIERHREEALGTALEQSGIGEATELGANITDVVSAIEDGAAFDERRRRRDIIPEGVQNRDVVQQVSDLKKTYGDLKAAVDLARDYGGGALDIGLASVSEILGFLEDLFDRALRGLLNYFDRERLRTSQFLSDIFGSLFFNRDPLILDLDGGGVSLTSLGLSNAYFDLNSNGFAERTGWVRAGDGLLALDVNNNGRIDNGTELFGTARQNGFAVLARYDDNRDGRITSADAVWSRLLVWRDNNGDGVSAAAELSAAAANDIGGINLNARAGSLGTRAGNPLLAVGSYTQTDGIGAEAIAVAFRNDQTNTRFVLPDGFEYDPEVFTLPNLRGYGTLPDLWAAMSLDPELKAMVQALIADIANYDSVNDFVGNSFVTKEPDFYRYGLLQIGETVNHYRASAFENILARWAGVPINDGLIVRDFDEAQMRAVAERLLGRSFVSESRLVGDLIHNRGFHAALSELVSQGAASNDNFGKGVIAA